MTGNANNHFHFGSFGVLKSLVNFGFRFHVNYAAAIQIYPFLFAKRHSFFYGFLIGIERQVHAFKSNLIYSASHGHIQRLFQRKFA